MDTSVLGDLRAGGARRFLHRHDLVAHRTDRRRRISVDAQHRLEKLPSLIRAEAAVRWRLHRNPACNARVEQEGAASPNGNLIDNRANVRIVVIQFRAAAFVLREADPGLHQCSNTCNGGYG